MVVRWIIRRAGPMRTLGSPIKMSATPPDASSSTAPGEHPGGPARGRIQRDSYRGAARTGERSLANEASAQDAASLVRDTGQRQSHLDAQRARQHQIVPKSPRWPMRKIALQLPETGAERHVEPFQHDLTKRIGVASSGIITSARRCIRGIPGHMSSPSLHGGSRGPCEASWRAKTFAVLPP